MRFVAERPFVVEVDFVAAGPSRSEVPGALPLGSDDDEGTDFDAEANAFDAVVIVVAPVTVAALDSANAVLFDNEGAFAISEEIVGAEKCVAEDAFVTETAFETDGTCAGEEFDADEGSITTWPSCEAHI